MSDSAAYGVQARTGGINGRDSQVGGLGGVSVAGLSPLNPIVRKLKRVSAISTMEKNRLLTRTVGGTVSNDCQYADS